MPCYHPLSGWRQRNSNQITFSLKNAYIDKPIQVPCGQCVGCRLERSRQWAIRCVHEASLHEKNCFVTLTYDDDNLPTDKSLHLEHFQKFMKRLRKKFGQNIRFYHCGEYGEKTQRPHYHVLLFNLDFYDKELWKTTFNNDKLYNSEQLSKLWKYGYSVIGDVTFQSAAYVARYIMKKVNGKNKEQHYERINEETGEVYQLKPEYTTMSRRPGIAHDHFIKHYKAIYANDHVIMNNIKIKPPKYYDNQFEIINPKGLERVKKKRIKNAKKHLTNNSNERLIVREHCVKLKIKKLIKKL